MRKNTILGKTIIFTIVLGALIPTTVEAANSKLISFNGSKISGGIHTKSSFYNDDGKCRVETNTTYDYSTTGGEILPLTMDAAKKSWGGYSRVGKNVYLWQGSKRSYFSVPAGEYKLYFGSGNYNYWSCYGAVYDD